MSIAPPDRKPGNSKLAALGNIDLEPKPTTRPLTAREDGTLVPLNFKVSPEFKRRLKLFAVENDVSMVDAMMTAVNAYMGEKG